MIDGLASLPLDPSRDNWGRGCETLDEPADLPDHITPCTCPSHDGVCDVCQFKVTVGPSGTEYGHARATNRSPDDDGTRRDCPKRPDSCNSGEAYEHQVVADGGLTVDSIVGHLKTDPDHRAAILLDGRDGEPITLRWEDDRIRSDGPGSDDHLYRTGEPAAAATDRWRACLSLLLDVDFAEILLVDGDFHTAETDDRMEAACALRDLADDLERSARQSSAEDVDVSLHVSVEETYRGQWGEQR